MSYNIRTVWTDERRAILAHDWPAGVPIRHIQARLACCPGEPIPDFGAIRRYAACTMGLHRPARPKRAETAP